MSVSLAFPANKIRITGSNLGPTTEADAKLDAVGHLPEVLGNSSVFFDNIPAPLITVQASFILCVAPFEIQKVSQVSVLSSGQRSNSVRMGVATSAPQILAIANQDNTLNSAVHPAKPGSVVVLYVSGLGETAPLSVDGSVNAPPLPVPLVPVAANVNGQSVTPQFVGAAPGFVAGITQINVQIPVAAYMVNPVNITVNTVSGQLFLLP